MFNIILPKPYEIFAKFVPNLRYKIPKPCEIFAKFLLKICQKFGKAFIMFFNKYNSGTFWQNDLF